MQLSTEVTGDLGVAVVSGDVDILHVSELEEAAAQMLRDGATSIAIDCRGVTFIDSAGLRAIVSALHLAQARGGTLTVRSPSALALRLMHATGLDTILTIEGDTDVADALD